MNPRGLSAGYRVKGFAYPRNREEKDHLFLTAGKALQSWDLQYKVKVALYCPKCFIYLQSYKKEAPPVLVISIEKQRKFLLLPYGYQSIQVWWRIGQ